MSDLAHIGHVELLTPRPQESLDFFVDVLGMEEEAREGGSVYLRSWGEWPRTSLKLTESEHAGIGHMGIRATSPAALERRAAAIEATGLGNGLDRRRRRPRPRLHVHRPRRPPDGALLRVRALRPAAAPAAVAEEPAAALHGARLRGQAPGPRQPAGRRRAGGARVRRRAARLPAARAHRARRRHRDRRLDEPEHRRARADLRRRRLRRARPAAPRRVLGRHARGGAAGGRHLPRPRRPHRGRAVQARRRAGVLPLRLRAGRQPRRGHHRRLLRLRPRLRADRLERGRARQGPGVGREDRARASTPTGRPVVEPA